MSCNAGATAHFNNMTLWLWVPAFAGTTIVDMANATHSVSSRRRPGPVRRGPRKGHKRRRLLSQLNSVVMGPGLRRDDARGVSPDRAYFVAEKRLSNEFDCTTGEEPASCALVGAAGAGAAAVLSVIDGFSAGLAACLVSAGFGATRTTDC